MLYIQQKVKQFQIGKFLVKWQHQKLKHIKQIDINCHIPELNSYVNNGGLHLVLKLAKHLTVSFMIH